MTTPDDLFPSRESYLNVGRGFMLMEATSPEWFEKFLKKYGPEVAFDFNMDSDRLKDIIVSTGNIRTFLADLTHDSTMIEAIRIDKYRFVGMIDKWTEDFEVYADTWARMMKIHLIQGANVMQRFRNSGDLGINGALDIDSYDLHNNRFDNDGSNKLKIEEFVNRLGPEGMLALHALFHSMSIDDFHDFLANPPGIEYPDTPMDSIVLLTRLVAKFVRPKNYLPPANYNTSGFHKVDGATLADLNLNNLHLN